MNSRNLAVFARFHRYTLSKLLLVLSLCTNGVYAGVTYSPALSGSALDGDTIATVTDTAAIGTKLTGTGKLTVQGTGTLTVDQWQQFTGGLVVDNGATVAFNATKGSGDAGAIIKTSITVNQGGTLRVLVNSTMSYGPDTPAVYIDGGTISSESSAGGTFILKECNFTNGGTVTDTRTGLTGWGGNIALDGRVKVDAGDAVISGERIVLSSRYQVNAAVPVYTHQFHVAEGATLTINGALQNVESNTSGVPTDARSLHKSGTGTLILNKPSTYKGLTKLVNGTIKLGADNAIPATSPVTFGYVEGETNYKGNIDLNGHNQTIVPDNYNSPTATTIRPIGSIYNDTSTLSTLTLNIPSSKTVATDTFSIKGNTKLVVDGGGKLDIIQAQTFTGGTVIKNGKVFIAGAGSEVLNSHKNGVLLNSITIEENGILELKSGGVMGYGRSGENGMPLLYVKGGKIINNCDIHNLLYNVALSNDGIIEDTATGKTGWAGNFGLDGTITVTSGTENVIRGEKLMLSSRYTPTVGTTPFNVSADATLTIDGNLMNPTTTISTDARNLTKSGDGVLILSGTNNTYKGVTTVSAGELRLDSGNLTDAVSLATSGISVSSGALLRLSSPVVLTGTNALVSLSSEDALSLDFTLEDLEAAGGTIKFMDDPNKLVIGGTPITLEQLRSAIPEDLRSFVIPSLNGGVFVSMDQGGVPEPASWLLLLFGLMGLKALKRHNK